MRPGQNKRIRGRNNNNNNNNRKGPNPLTRSYESNGPDVKIRGTAHHVGEKYLQLARDAQSSGDPVMAESYLQHAEHYFRLIAAAQLAQQQSAYGYQRTPTEQAEADDEADDDFDSLPDRFASPTERAAVAQPQPVPAAQPYADRQPYNGGNANEQRAERFPNSNQQAQPDYQRAERQQNDRSYSGDRQNYDRQDRQQQDRQQQDRQQQDRQQQDRPQQERQYDNRNGRDRGNYQERFQNNQDRNNQDRNNQDRQQNDRSAQGNQDRNNQDRPARDYDNRSTRNNRGSRDFQPREQRESRQPVVDEAPSTALPAFITAPVRVPVEATPEPVVAAAVPAIDQGDDSGFLLRPRRRRRPKAEFATGDSEGQNEAPAGDAVGE